MFGQCPTGSKVKDPIILDKSFFVVVVALLHTSTIFYSGCVKRCGKGRKIFNKKKDSNIYEQNNTSVWVCWR